MKAHLLYSLLSASVVAGTTMVASAVTLTWVPKGAPRQAVERVLIAPGKAVYKALRKQKKVKKAMKAGEKRIEKGKEMLSEAAEAIEDTLDEAGVTEAAAVQRERLQHLYNVSAMALAGFILSLLLALYSAVGSARAALALGFRVTMTLFFLQGAGLLALYLMHKQLPT